MIDTARFDPLGYVTAAAPLVGLELTPERARAVAEALALLARIAEPALAFELAAEIEPAPIFIA